MRSRAEQAAQRLSRDACFASARGAWIWTGRLAESLTTARSDSGVAAACDVRRGTLIPAPLTPALSPGYRREGVATFYFFAGCVAGAMSFTSVSGAIFARSSLIFFASPTT